MKRFTSIEIGGLILGVLLFCGGLDAVIWPQSGVVPHFTNDVWGMSPRTDMEVVSTTGARVYGILAMLLGAGIAAMAVCREKK
jgi:hypothetical protein